MKSELDFVYQYELITSNEVVEMYSPILRDFVDCCFSKQRKLNIEKENKVFDSKIVSSTITEYEVKIHFNGYDELVPQSEKECAISIVQDFGEFLKTF